MVHMVNFVLQMIKRNRVKVGLIFLPQNTCSLEHVNKLPSPIIENTE